ncbi:uncharacterized protein LOC123517663 [Portunus trituberculatus]|uniref:uncharacterized protein LOC123517663 n=1 Tax=Portunus trituberculatus TaxID=210409 RepID=UPI001E1CD267|nr:uncharacterized protein LOC123517663 [Portunus trituberculatus]
MERKHRETIMATLYVILLAIVMENTVCLHAEAKGTDGLFPLPSFPPLSNLSPLPSIAPTAPENTTEDDDNALQLKEATLCSNGGSMWHCGPGEAELWGVSQEDEFSLNLHEMSAGIRTLLHSKDFTRLWAIIPRTILLSFPQKTLLGNVLGLDTSSFSAHIAAVVFFGWPFLMLGLYIFLILHYPNKKSGSDFEKMVTHMAESWSHVMYAAEDNFLNFMEDVTDHGHHDQGHGHHHDPHHHHDQGHHHGHASFHPRIEYNPEYNPDVSLDQHTFYNHYYNEHGHDEHQEYVWQDHAFHDGSSAPSAHRPYMTEAPAHTGDIIQLTNKFGYHNNIPDEEEITRLNNKFGLHNNIPDEQKIKYLNIVLGGNYRQTTDQPLVQDGHVASLSSSYGTFHTWPPIGHSPHHHSQITPGWHQKLDIQRPFYPTRGPSFVSFQHDSQPLRDGYPYPRFRPSVLMQESLREDWVAALDPKSTLNETDAKETSITSKINDDEDETTVATTTRGILTASP